ncbi:Pc22g18400 [Penicillium rubens Wisconsin 54-1255]|uniref:Pc22g18400 protein n=2 Tax=Penicillium chrysogenum species complex TaxID=254878 RepID=B6HUL2_PENRW|nr:Pc22g18400 [Penicillium rubens Wisconsin 54-1255]
MGDAANRALLDEQSSPIERSPERTSSDQPRPSYELSSESTPLLHRRDDELAYGTEQGLLRSPSVASQNPPEDGAIDKRSRVPWPTVISLSILTLGVLTILVLAFAAPAAVKEYAQHAAVFKPTAVSIDSTTPDGVRARIQGDFVMDSGRVKNKSVRGIGRLATWIAREVETGPSKVEVYLPEYGNVLVGNAALPSIKVNIRNGHHTNVDFLTDLEAGDIRGIHAVAIDWIEGRLGRLNVKGKATLNLKSGLFALGTQVLTDNIIIGEHDFPALPMINILKLNMHDANSGGMAVDVLLSSLIDSPVALTVPALGFDVLVPNCSPGDPYILVADAKTSAIDVHPGQETAVGVEGLIQQLPDELISTCPGQEGSPLDLLVSSYMQGLETTIYVRGSDAPSLNTPAWIVDLLRSVTVPLPFTGHALDNLVKNFTMSDTHFSLPNPFAEPDSPDSRPTVSAFVKVLIALPEEMNFQVEVPQVRALADVYYKEEKFGVLNISHWQDANSTLVDDQDGSSALLVEFAIKDAPLEVTDDGLLTEVIQAMLFGSETVVLRVAATVDTKVSTGLGRFALRGIPAEGNVPVKTSVGNSLDQVNPRVISLQLGNTTESSMLVSTLVNFTNPTNYSVTVPFVDLLILYNDTAVAHVTAQNISVGPGNNSYVPIDFFWCPSDAAGVDGIEAGRALLSSYVSSFNTTITIKSHRNTIPSLPDLGEALSILNITVPVPRISVPGSDDKDTKPHFIQDATFYLWTSTADFTLSSPLTENNILITSIDATAFYEKKEPIGRIDDHEPFEVPPGISKSPRLPVNLDMGGVGYDALRKALGQSLEMDAVAKVGVMIGNYMDIIIYHGKGIAAKVRI